MQDHSASKRARERPVRSPKAGAMRYLLRAFVAHRSEGGRRNAGTKMCRDGTVMMRCEVVGVNGLLMKEKSLKKRRTNEKEGAGIRGRGGAGTGEAGSKGTNSSVEGVRGGRTAPFSGSKDKEPTNDLQRGRCESHWDVVHHSAGSWRASCETGMRYGRADTRAKTLLFLKLGCT